MASKTNPRSSQSFLNTACYRCNKNVFQLEKIIVDDHCLHESCFVCESCSQRLTSSNYVEIEGKYYCLKDSHEIKPDKGISNNLDTSTSKSEGKLCPLCKKHVISAEGIVLDNEDLVHRSCFVCNECKSPLSLGNFHTIEEKFFCTRHFFQRSTSDVNINGRKKARDLFAGSLDADPLQSSLSDLEKQEKKQQQDNNSSEVVNDPEPSKPSENPSTDENTNSNMPDASKKSRETQNDASEEGRDPDTARSVSMSETDYQDLTDDDLERVESDVTTASEKSEGASKSSTIVQNKDEKELKSPRDTLKGSRSKDRKKNKGRNRKDPDDSKSKKKKKKKMEKSETEENTEDKDSGRKRGRRDKGPRKLRKNPSGLKDDLEVEDSKEEKTSKKKTKRGLFNIKKKPQRGSGRKDSVDVDSPSHSPSLTSFVTSRFRKKRDASADNLPKPVKEPIKSVPLGKLEESSDEEEDGDLAPLGTPEKKNRISRLTSKESIKSGTPARSVTAPVTAAAAEPKLQAPVVVQKILPVSLEIPSCLKPISYIPVCENTLEEDISLDALDLPKEKEDKPVYEWTSYELNREFAPLELNLPDDVITKTSDEKEKILQSGFFEPEVIKIGLVGVHRRLLEFTSILATTFPFSTQFIGGSDISPQALQILHERHGDTFQDIPLTALLHEDVDWIFVDSQYVDTAQNIEAALRAGKNVFCEKPVCSSVADCLRLREAHKQSGKKFIGGFVWRLVPFYQEIYDILHCGILGEIVSVEINNLLDPSEGGLLMQGWTRNKKRSRSPLFDTFCFEIDILNWLLDSIPSRVGSFSGLNIYVPKNKPGSPEELEPYLDWSIKPIDTDISSKDPFSAEKDIDDNHVFIMEYRNHTRATCHINTNSAFPQRRILICGVKGTLEGDLYTGMIRFKTIGDQYETNLIQVTPGLAHGGGDQQIMEDLVDTTRNLPANCFEGEELFPSIITVLGIDQSKEKGTIVDLEPQWEQLGI